jgi:hypothetical protein
VGCSALSDLLIPQDHAKQEFPLTLSRFRFGLGLLIALIAAVLLFLDVIESGVAAMIGVIGIGLIASSTVVRR